MPAVHVGCHAHACGGVHARSTRRRLVAGRREYDRRVAEQAYQKDARIANGGQLCELLSEQKDGNAERQHQQEDEDAKRFPGPEG